jgi:hypothetical protein
LHLGFCSELPLLATGPPELLIHLLLAGFAGPEGWQEPSLTQDHPRGKPTGLEYLLIPYAGMSHTHPSQSRVCTPTFTGITCKQSPGPEHTGPETPPSIQQTHRMGTHQIHKEIMTCSYMFDFSSTPRPTRGTTHRKGTCSISFQLRHNYNDNCHSLHALNTYHVQGIILRHFQKTPT